MLSFQQLLSERGFEGTDWPCGCLWLVDLDSFDRTQPLLQPVVRIATVEDYAAVPTVTLGGGGIELIAAFEGAVGYGPLEIP